MRIDEFLEACLAFRYLFSRGEHQGTDGWFVRPTWLNGTGQGEPPIVHLSRSAVENQDWPALDKAIRSGRDAD